MNIKKTSYVYTVKYGDNLSGIAAKFLGSSNKDRWVELLKINPQMYVRYPYNGKQHVPVAYLHVGEKINIPSNWLAWLSLQKNGMGISGVGLGFPGVMCAGDANCDSGESCVSYHCQAVTTPTGPTGPIGPTPGVSPWQNCGTDPSKGIYFGTIYCWLNDVQNNIGSQPQYGMRELAYYFCDSTTQELYTAYNFNNTLIDQCVTDAFNWLVSNYAQGNNDYSAILSTDSNPNGIFPSTWNTLSDDNLLTIIQGVQKAFVDYATANNTQAVAAVQAANQPSTMDDFCVRFCLSSRWYC